MSTEAEGWDDPVQSEGVHDRGVPPEHRPLTPWRATARTFIQAFLGLYIPRLFGFLQQLGEWAGCREAAVIESCTVPGVGALGYGLVVAGSAASIALVTFLMNQFEVKTGNALLK